MIITLLKGSCYWSRCARTRAESGAEMAEENAEEDEDMILVFLCDVLYDEVATYVLDIA
jgi:hypothetical protein